MRLLLYVLMAWIVLSILAALFFGRLCGLSEDLSDISARPPSTPSRHRRSLVCGSGCTPVDNCGCRV